MPKSAKAEAGKEGERVYLLRGRTLEMGPGHSVCYPAGYYQPSEITEGWMRDGLAVPESEWESRLAEAEKAAAADPVMHLAGPRAPVPPASAPAGQMWAQGPKDSHKPAVEPTAAPGKQPAGPAPPDLPPAAPTQEIPDVQTSASQDQEE